MDVWLILQNDEGDSTSASIGQKEGADARAKAEEISFTLARLSVDNVRFRHQLG